jgi:D-sedoheptulose 7-phosphate isomerase
LRLRDTNWQVISEKCDVVGLLPSKEGNMSYTTQYFEEARQIIENINSGDVEKMVDLMVTLRDNRGRLFFLGSGGGAGHASHAVCDFRKIANIEAYAPTDNVSELTARVNDECWETVFVNWLHVSNLGQNDMVFIFSVGGGDNKKNVSPNIVRALQYAQQIGAKICGIVGRDGGFTAKVADACVIVPTINSDTVTPHTEAFQALIWHLMVSHPKLKATEMRWESIQ